MVEAALLISGGLLASFAAAAGLVFAVVRLTQAHRDERGVDHSGWPDPWGHAPRRFRRRAEPPWWPEFERAFADHVRTSAGRQS